MRHNGLKFIVTSLLSALMVMFKMYFQFLQLLRTLGGQVGSEDLPGQRSLAHLPPDERTRVAAEREEALQILSSRVTALKQRIERKDQLLQGYENDLEKLRYYTGTCMT